MERRRLSADSSESTLPRYRPFQGSSSTDELPSPSVGSSLPRAAKPATFVEQIHTRLRVGLSSHIRPRMCAASPQLSLALRSYRAKDSFSTQPSPSPERCNAGATPRRTGDSPLRQELLRNVTPLPQCCFQPFGSRSLLRSLSLLRCSIARSYSQADLYQVRTTASCLWLYVSPQRRFFFRPAIRGLSYPELQRFLLGSTPSRFPLRCLPHHCGLISHPLRERCRCRHFGPAASSRVGLVHSHSSTARSARHCLRAAVSRSPSISRVARTSESGSRGSLQTLAPISAQ